MGSTEGNADECLRDNIFCDIMNDDRRGEGELFKNSEDDSGEDGVL